MPPRARESNSESESRTSGRTGNKTRGTGAGLDNLGPVVHSNGPHDFPPVDPFDFTAFSSDALERYNLKYGLGLPEVQSVTENILQSEVGRRSFTARRTAQSARISKPELAAHCYKHFVALPCRETEILSSFLYKVKNEDREFKLTF